MKTQRMISWICRLIAAAILLQALYFKFAGSEESVYIFSALGVEPWGRIGTAIFELIVAILLIVPRTAWLGAPGGIGLMTGAILSHVFVLGIEIMGDGGLLFGMGIVVLVCCIVVAYQSKARYVRLIKPEKS